MQPDQAVTTSPYMTMIRANLAVLALARPAEPAMATCNAVSWLDGAYDALDLDAIGERVQRALLDLAVKRDAVAAADSRCKVSR